MSKEEKVYKLVEDAINNYEDSYSSRFNTMIKKDFDIPYYFDREKVDCIIKLVKNDIISKEEARKLLGVFDIQSIIHEVHIG